MFLNLKAFATCTNNLMNISDNSLYIEPTCTIVFTMAMEALTMTTREA